MNETNPRDLLLQVLFASPERSLSPSFLQSIQSIFSQDLSSADLGSVCFRAMKACGSTMNSETYCIEFY